MIAVCITTYNHASFIAEAIKSVLAQECDEPVRIYVGDDASTDGTETVCRRLAAQDDRIVYIRRQSLSRCWTAMITGATCISCR